MTDRPHPDDADYDRVFNAETRRALRQGGRESLRLGTLIVVFTLLMITGYTLTGVTAVAATPVLTGLVLDGV
jgi:hypothetical protein